jgi:NAD(P)-dependent dehydrogenase (short-subunit alcohol dehydrogenase family)
VDVMAERAISIPEFDLTGRVAVVTGGNRSIGRGAALCLAEAGADVVLGAREKGDLEQVAAEISERGRQALPVVCDVSDEAAVDNLFGQTLDRFGKVDIAVVNAGIFQKWQSSELMELEEWDNIYAINLRGAMLTSMAAGRQMIKQGTGGSIITIASIQGLVSIRGTMAYTASKHGVVGMTKTLAVDWAKHNIRVNCICPGFIARDVEPLQSNPEAIEFVTTNTPLGRWGTTRELGLTILFLAAPASGYVTGATLAVDGGWCAQ